MRGAFLKRSQDASKRLIIKIAKRPREHNHVVVENTVEPSDSIPYVTPLKISAWKTALVSVSPLDLVQTRVSQTCPWVTLGFQYEVEAPKIEAAATPKGEDTEFFALPTQHLQSVGLEPMVLGHIGRHVLQEVEPLSETAII